MEYKRHVILDSPERKSQVQIYEYEDNLVVWLNESPDIFTPKGNRTVNDIMQTFLRVLQRDGCRIISDQCA